ncbi:hypothetical protein Tco_0673598 [Tanacetum coccineum]
MSQPANDEFSQHLSDEESNHEDASDTGAAPKQQQQVIPQTTAISNIKLPILKKEEYDIWAMEMEHYLEYIDNEVWKVIQNGNSKKRISTGKDEHMRRFHGMDDAKEIWEAIRTRFGGNANSKKMQKALLSQLEAHGAEVSTEDANHKFLRSFPPAWSNLAMTMRTNPEIDTLSIDEFKSSTNKVKSGFTGAYSTCTPSTSSTNILEKEILAGFANEVIYSLFAKQSEDWDLLHEDLEQIDDVNIEEMDINCQIAMIAIRMKKECTAKGTHDGKKKRDSLYQHQEAGKQEKNQMGLLTMDDGIVNWGEHTEAEETNHALMAISSSNEVTLCSKTCIDSYNSLKTLCDEQMNQLGDQEAQILAYSQAVKKLEAQLVTFQKQQLSLNEKLTFQANEIYEKDEKLKRYRRIGMKAVKEKEQLQKTLDSWKDSSKNLWRLIESGMSSNSKVGLGFEIQSNNEVLSYEEEMNFSVFNCSKEDSIGKPLYSRFSKTNDFKGVPHPLSGDYTPKSQEEIDDSLYVYGKQGPQKPEISVSDDNSSEHSTYQSNDSEGSCGNTFEHSFETESESLSVPNEVSKSRLEVTNEKVVSELQEVEPSCAKHVKTPRQPLKDKETQKVNRKNWNDMMERELGEDNMANENVPALAPIISDDQILPFGAWVPIGKTSVPAIYIQQFWNTLTQEAKTGAYRFQLDGDWFILDANLLREALEITPIDQAHQFESPPLGNAIMDFVNKLGYPEELHFVSRMAVNHLYQPWRAILSLINQCLIEFIQAIQTFLADKANLGIATKKDKKTKPYVIPYCRFTKLIICYLGRKTTLTKDPSPAKQSKRGKVGKVCKGNSPLKLIDEDEEAPVGGVAFREPALGITQKLPIVEVLTLDEDLFPTKGIATDEQRRILVTEKEPTGASVQPEDDTSANIVRDTPSPTDAETGVETDKTNNEGDTEILNIGEEQRRRYHAGPDRLGQSHGLICLVPDPEHMHDNFVATVYPQVHESLKHPDEEHVHMENPLSSTRTLSSMKNLEAFTFATTVTTTTTLLLPPPPQQQSSSDPDLASRVSALEQVCANFEKRHKLQDKTVQGLSSRVFTLELRDMSHQINQTVNEVPEHVALYEALKASMDRDNRDEFLEATTKSQVPILDDVNILDSEDTDTAHLPKIKTRPDWLKPIPKEDRPETPEPDWVIPSNDLPKDEKNWADALAKSYKDPEENKLLSKTKDMGSFIKWYCKRIGKKKLTKDDLEGPAYMTVKSFHTNSISLQFQMEEFHRLLSNNIDLMNPEGHRVVPDVSKPLPLGGPPGDNERRCALSISKLKAAHYLDFGLEELVSSLWIESERDYDISATYGKLNHLPGSDKVHLFNAVNMWIRNIVIRQRVVDLQLGIESYQTKLNITQPSWDASDFPFKEDYTIVSKPRAVIYRDRSDQKKMIRLNEVHKFSDGTLTRVLERLNHMVKDFRLFKYNPGMETRIWSEDDKRRSKEFMEVIERRLKIRRIFRSLESFVSGRLRDVDYRLIQRTE